MKSLATESFAIFFSYFYQMQNISTHPVAHQITDTHQAYTIRHDERSFSQICRNIFTNQDTFFATYYTSCHIFFIFSTRLSLPQPVVNTPSMHRLLLDSVETYFQNLQPHNTLSLPRTSSCHSMRQSDDNSCPHFRQLTILYKAYEC